jgi:hypothetical protein
MFIYVAKRMCMGKCSQAFAFAEKKAELCSIYGGLRLTF